MKLIGKINKESNRIIIEPTRYIEFQYDKDKEYDIEIKPMANRRTIQQNRYLWALINEICMTEDGNISNAENMYNKLLQMAGAKYSLIAIKPNAYEELKKIYRHITIRGKEKGYLICQVFYGSSQMNTSEMAKLIDTALNYAYEIEVPSFHYYKELLERGM